MKNALFMGKILASVTHEMQNIMAIIKESGALVDDILTINGRPKMKHADKLESALTNISEQTSRGRNLMRTLNGFAHAAESSPESSDLTQVASTIESLTVRIASLKECNLRLAITEAPVTVRGNALVLMHTIYFLLAGLLDRTQAGDTITITVHESGKVTFTGIKEYVVTSCSEELKSLLQETGTVFISEPDGPALLFAKAGVEKA